MPARISSPALRKLLAVLIAAFVPPSPVTSAEPEPVGREVTARPFTAAALAGDNRVVLGSGLPASGDRWLWAYRLGSGEARYSLQAKLITARPDARHHPEELFWAHAPGKDHVFARFRSGGPVYVWDIREEKVVAELKLPDALRGRWFSADVAVSINGRHLAVRRGRARFLHDRESGEWSSACEWPGTALGRPSDRDGSLLLLGAEGRLMLREPGEAPVPLACHDGSVVAADFLPGGERAVSVGTDRTLRVWDVAERRATRTITIKGEPVSLAVSPAGGEVMVFTRSGEARGWDIDAGEEAFTIPASRQDKGRRVVYSPDGQYALGYGGERQQLWRLRPNERELPDHFGTLVRKPTPSGEPLTAPTLLSGFLSADGSFAVGLTASKVVTAV